METKRARTIQKNKTSERKSKILILFMINRKFMKKLFIIFDVKTVVCSVKVSKLLII